MVSSYRLVQHRLTEPQSHLLARHRRALIRLAGELARRGGVHVGSVMFVLADVQGHVGAALRAALAWPTVGAVVLPSAASQLEAWTEQLARHAPVWDLQATRNGTIVIVIDKADAIAVTRVSHED